MLESVQKQQRNDEDINQLITYLDCRGFPIARRQGAVPRCGDGAMVMALW